MHGAQMRFLRFRWSVGYGGDGQLRSASHPFSLAAKLLKESTVIDESQGLGQFEPEASMSGLGEAARKRRPVAISRSGGARSEPHTQRGRATMPIIRRISDPRRDLLGFSNFARLLCTPVEPKSLRSAIATIARGALGVFGSTCEAAAGVLAIGVVAAETCSRSCAAAIDAIPDGESTTRTEPDQTFEKW
jgi:hypothetical protein